MRKALSAALAAILLASSLPGCILTPIDRNRRQVTNWDLELVNFKGGIQTIPVAVFGTLFVPVAWVVDSVIVNPIDSYKGAVLDTHNTDWDDEKEGESQAQVKSYPRSFGSLLLMPLDFAWRANTPWKGGPHDAKLWKEYWNEHVEVTESNATR